MSEPQISRPPRDDLVRALPPVELELRDDSGDERGPVMSGYFARFNEWTEIDSVFEGNFLERVAPSAFTKTLAENGPQIRVLFEHGQDPQLGSKPLGVPDVLEVRRQGPYFEVPLFHGVPELVVSGLRAGSYGSSFRFSVQRESFNRDAKPSEHNPKGLPERTLQEVAVREFGPVTFPAYKGATAGVRSLTDEFLLGRFVNSPDRLRELVETTQFARWLLDEYLTDKDQEDECAPPADAAPTGTSARDAAPTTATWPVAPHDVWEEEFWTQ